MKTYLHISGNGKYVWSPTFENVRWKCTMKWLTQKVSRAATHLQLRIFGCNSLFWFRFNFSFHSKINITLLWCISISQILQLYKKETAVAVQCRSDLQTCFISIILRLCFKVHYLRAFVIYIPYFTSRYLIYSVSKLIWLTISS